MRGWTATALIVGLALCWPALVTADALAAVSAHGKKAHAKSARRKKPANHSATVLSVSPVAAPAHPAKPAATGGVRTTAASSVAVPVAPARCANGKLRPGASNLGIVAAAMLCLINHARQAAGLAGLVENADLDTAAVGHSGDMVAENYFDHVGPDGLGPEQRVLASGFAIRAADGQIAENIASGTSTEATPAATVASWMASAGHRQNILNPAFRQTGLGVVAFVPSLLGAGAGGTYTEDFG